MNLSFRLAITIIVAGISPVFSQQIHHRCHICTPVSPPDVSMAEWLAQRGLRFDVVKVQTVHGKQVVAVPHNSVVENSGRYFILKRNERAPELLEPSEITPGQWNNHFVEARAGVALGDLIVTREIFPRPSGVWSQNEKECSCSQCVPNPVYGNPNGEPVKRQSDDYQSGFRDGYLADTRQFQQEEKSSHSHSEHHCGGECNGCAEADEEIVFRKKNAKDPLSGYLVPQK